MTTILHGDSQEVLKGMESDSVDSVVCDPPYELGFMGKSWDASGIAYSVDLWREVLRVLKPGGHLLAFGGTRTYHRMACAIEDAGFEIRDSLHWVYGTGFPKSLDVSKALDNAGGVPTEGQARDLKARREAARLTREELAARIGCTPSSIRDWEEGRARAKGRPIEWIVPSPEYRAKLAEAIGYSEDAREVVGESTDRRGDGTVAALGHSGTLRTGGNTDLARQWQGWGTALKPAHEPIVMARKPLIGTVAANVAAHGTGALNIDGCRIATDENPSAARRAGKAPEREAGTWANDRRSPEAFGAVRPGESLGRWPANLVLSPEAAEALDAQSGTLKSGSGQKNTRRATGEIFAAASQSANAAQYPASEGGASRFFYVAKPSRKERGEGNAHPTVKPVELMRYLVRLVTPPGGTVLDPFGGSGTTALACRAEGFSCTLIERDFEYVSIAKKRLGGVLL